MENDAALIQIQEFYLIFSFCGPEKKERHINIKEEKKLQGRETNGWERNW